MRFGGEHGVPTFQPVKLPASDPRPALLRILDANGQLVRVVEPQDFPAWRKEGLLRCRYHGTAECPKCLRNIERGGLRARRV
ncbi:MAG TPA: hypothetical protein DCQ64_01285 [Candidatus Rokubacteria bacterium]|nr:hypothetical protein [Candidatus Rokubacteria bacterium]